MLFGCELKVENVSSGKTVYRFKFDPRMVPADETKWLLEQLRTVRDIDSLKRVLREAEKILLKGSMGNGRLSLDPAYAAAAQIIIHSYSDEDIGLWWCDYRSKGKMFTSTLCTDPYIEPDRRAVALNPWSLNNPGDLDTIIDSRGYHKGGSIGKSPFSFSTASFANGASIVASFTAASTTTVRSILLLFASYTKSTSRTRCDFNVPAPPGTCDSRYYASIYMPAWGWDVSFTVVEGDAYTVKLRLYV